MAWKKKAGEEGAKVEEETQLGQQKGEQPTEGEPTEAQREYEERVQEIVYEMRKGLKWASDLTGAIHRALEDRTPLVVTERDLDALEFYQLVLSYASPDVIADALKDAEKEERAKMDSDVSIS